MAASRAADSGGGGAAIRAFVATLGTLLLALFPLMFRTTNTALLCRWTSEGLFDFVRPVLLERVSPFGSGAEVVIQILGSAA